MGVGVSSIVAIAILLGQAGAPAGDTPGEADQVDRADPPEREASTEADAQQPLVPYPHPLITEVLFAVPASGGDANKDGTRHATGDEFIEITNPHDEPISLAGYRLVDRHRGQDGRFAFTFPDLMLEPGQTAVVFNGLDATWTGPVGDTHRAPPGPNPLFEGAFIFTADVPSRYVALANQADFVMLENAMRVPVHVVVWGNPDQTPPTDAYHVDTITGIPRASVQRTDATGAMAAHDRIDGKTCSPGVAYPKPPALQDRPAESP